MIAVRVPASNYCTCPGVAGPGAVGDRGSGWWRGCDVSTQMILMIITTKTAMKRIPKISGRMAMIGIVPSYF
jgi:hypothetical protein